MKRKFGIMLTMAFAAVALTSCLKGDDTSGGGTNSEIVPGLYIYNAVVTQNAMSMQPADVAIRFAMLYSEAVKQDKLDDLDRVLVDGAGNVKSLLFGVTTRITKTDTGYEIAYAGGGGQSPQYDGFSRRGTVRIDMGGVALEQTEITKPWRVSLATAKLEILTSDRDFALTSTGDMTIYRMDDQYEIGFRGAASYIDAKIPASWTGTFIWTPEKADDLSFSALKGTTIKFRGSGMGPSFWTFNRSESVKMAYQLSDGQYAPHKINSTHITGGTETCRLTDPTQVDPTVYPSPEVQVVWTMKELRLSYVVKYNGFSEEFIY